MPLGDKAFWRYTDDFEAAVGPGRLQAVAMLDSPEDLPLYMRELWLTEDEKAFHRVPLPWERMAFGGMVFASDGALLMAEAKDPLSFCAAACKPGRIWRLPPGETEVNPLPDAPSASDEGGVDWSVRGGLYYAGGGILVAHTGRRTIALSADGYTWSRVRPGSPR